MTLTRKTKNAQINSDMLLVLKWRSSITNTARNLASSDQHMTKPIATFLFNQIPADFRNRFDSARQEKHIQKDANRLQSPGKKNWYLPCAGR